MVCLQSATATPIQPGTAGLVTRIQSMLTACLMIRIKSVLAAPLMIRVESSSLRASALEIPPGMLSPSSRSRHSVGSPGVPTRTGAAKPAAATASSSATTSGVSGPAASALFLLTGDG
jgi:hypothetical protein